MQNHAESRIRVVTRIADIPQTEWDGECPPNVENYLFFKTIEETLSEQFRPYYIVVYEQAGIRIIAPCYIMDYPLVTTFEGRLKTIAQKIQKNLPNLLTLRVMMCGCPAAPGRLGISGPSPEKLMPLLAGEMLRIAKKENARVIAFKDFGEEYAEFFRPLLKNGFYKVQSYPCAELEIKFSSFEEYLSSLSRVTRKGLRRKFRSIDGKIDIKMEVAREPGPLLDQIYRLYLNNLEISEVQFEIITKEFFRKISDYMPNETRYFLWRVNGELAAFDLCLVSKGTLVDEYIGMDYSIAYKYHLYYATFRDILNWCLENGIKKYQTGALGYDPKKHLRFKFIPQYIYARHVGAVGNLLLGLLCMALKPANFDPILKEMRHN